MKKLKARELMWMILPVVLLGGTAWWFGSGGSAPFRIPNAGQLVADARRPTLTLEKVVSSWNSPTSSVLMGNEKGCNVTVYLSTSASLMKVQPTSVPSFSSTDVVDEKGRSIKAILARKRGFHVGISESAGAVGRSQPDGSVKNVPLVDTLIPFANIPPGTKSATFKGTVTWGTASPLHVQFEVLPAWMRRSAKRLKLETVRWRPNANNATGDVEVLCTLAAPRNPIVYGISGGLIHPTRVGIGYDPQDQDLPASGDVLLAEWSQRIESGDGRLNSLDLLRDHIQKKVDKVPYDVNGGKSVSPEAFLGSFDPLCRGPKVQIKGNKIHLSYNVSRIPKMFKNPIFRCEIYLVSDGMLNVRCPINPKTAK